MNIILRRIKAKIIRDDGFIWFECPKCDWVGKIDDDQYNGRVSVVCVNKNCDYHETHNFKEIEESK